ncbi:hypothetical protein [Enterococcus gallinarum]|uniref:hypothetical protein n=1 Tax=Enterococcus gallinarum TaxID=1353 RepID=UPI002DB5D723|nr:hypothetical protein [Enterococcus gallinarum]MEB6041199.1 hypothetical protein [Enterococcus gallinarum]
MKLKYRALKIFKNLKTFFKGVKQKPSSVFLALLTLLLGMPFFQEWLVKISFVNYLYIFLILIVFIWDIQGQGDQIEKHENKIDELTTDNNEMEEYNEMLLSSLASLPTDFLELVFKELCFNSSERISLYTFRENSFVIAGRYASVKPLMTQGRQSYPEGEGYIGKAWRCPDSSDTYYKDGLPDYEQEQDLYIETVKTETGLKKGVIKTLTMHSRSYYVKLIRDHGNPIGIIVLESNQPKFPKKKDEITNILDGMSGNHLATLIKVNEQANGGKFNAK